jgi:ribulose-5-phosphate 4-epimerase/fuculose-1-phosphate aldolase
MLDITNIPHGDMPRDKIEIEQSHIAKATSKLMKKYQAAVWTHHGLFVTGPDFDTAFGLAHTIEKSAEIYIKILSTGKDILQTITDDDLRAIGKDFHVAINEEFLTQEN